MDRQTHTLVRQKIEEKLQLTMEKDGHLNDWKEIMDKIADQGQKAYLIHLRGELADEKDRHSSEIKEIMDKITALNRKAYRVQSTINKITEKCMAIECELHKL